MGAFYFFTWYSKPINVFSSFMIHLLDNVTFQALILTARAVSQAQRCIFTEGWDAPQYKRLRASIFAGP